MSEIEGFLKETKLEEYKEAIYYHGDTLRKAIHDTPPTTEFLIRGLIPEKSLTQFYAPDGIGKSTVVLQMLLEASSGSPAFRGIEVKRPLKVAIYLAERPAAEAFTRMLSMEEGITIDYNNVLIDDSLQGYDITKEDDQIRFLRRVMDTCFNAFPDGVDIIFIDPIYALLPTGLESAQAAGHVNMLLRRIKSRMNCALIYTHHANRGSKNPETGKREHMDMYGNRFISANVTGVFKIIQTETGTIFKKEKDSWSCLVPQINLTFNPENYISSVDENSSTINLSEKMESFILAQFRLKKDFYYDKFKKDCGVSDSHARDTLSGHLKSGRIINCNPKGKKALYKILREF